jgi:hypothetical protein
LYSAVRRNGKMYSVDCYEFLNSVITPCKCCLRNRQSARYRNWPVWYGLNGLDRRSERSYMWNLGLNACLINSPFSIFLLHTLEGFPSFWKLLLTLCSWIGNLPQKATL